MSTLKLYALGGLAVFIVVSGICLWIFRAGVDAEKTGQIKTAVKVKEKQDEARNNRPDVPGIVNSLLDTRL